MESLHDLDADTAFVGVDVGGTSTVVQAVRGSVVRVIDGPGANLQRSGRESCAAAVIMLSAQALRSLHGVDRVRMVAGVSGAGRLEEQIGVAAEIEEGLHALHVARAISVTVVHDAEIALEAAFGGSSGAIMIAGTGSVVYGRRADGSTVRTGGWGYLLGDEGSGYRLGKLALGAICRAYEGGEDTTLTDSIASAFGARSVDEVISLVYGGGIRLADLAPHVTECAVTGDGVAFSILRQETEALAEQLERMATANPDIEPQYSLFGGLAGVNLFAHNLRSAVRRRLPNWHYVATDALPVAGAVRMARATSA